MPRHIDGQASISAVAPAADVEALKALAQRNGRNVSQELRMALNYWLQVNADPKTGGFVRMGDAYNANVAFTGEITLWKFGEEVEQTILPGCTLVFPEGQVTPNVAKCLDEQGNWITDAVQAVVLWNANHIVPLVTLTRLEMEGDWPCTKPDPVTGEPVTFEEVRYLQAIRVEHE